MIVNRTGGGVSDVPRAARQGNGEFAEGDARAADGGGGQRTPFRPKVRFRGSEWARLLRLVAFLFGNGIKCKGHRQTCVTQVGENAKRVSWIRYAVAEELQYIAKKVAIAAAERMVSPSLCFIATGGLRAPSGAR